MGHVMSLRGGYRGVMIVGTDYQVIEPLEVDGHRAQLIERSSNRREWCSSCDEYRAVKPLSMKARREHCEWAVTTDRPCRHIA